MLLFFARIQLLKTLWVVTAKRAKLSYVEPEEMLDVMQLQRASK